MIERSRRLPAGQWGKWKGSRFAETIPSLEEMLAVVPRGKRIFIVKQIRKAGLKLYIWTVDDPAVALRLAGAGVDGITTNRPKWLREQLNAHGD